MAHFVPRHEKKSLKIIGMGALGGALPDFDAISLWSKFDSTIGSWLNLTHTGRDIYFNTFPYSHHGAMHSFLFPILIVATFFLLQLLFAKIKGRKNTSISSKWNNAKWYVFTFLGAYCLHVIEDMPTPGCVWGGVNLWWPSDIWVGGSGSIWWWNNYDLFLIVISIILINLVLLIVRKASRRSMAKFASIVFGIGLAIGLKQIATRGYDFDYEGFSTDYNTMEQKSKEIQQEILGDTVFGWMEKLDNEIPLNF